MSRRRAHKRGEWVAKILWFIDEHGSATSADIKRALGISDEVVRSIMSRLNRYGQKTGKRLYIVAWCFEAHGERNYPRPIYARYEGAQHRDAPKPTRGR